MLNFSLEEIDLCFKMARLDIVDGFVRLRWLEWTRALSFSLEEVDLGDQMARLDIVDGFPQWLVESWRGNLRLED